MTSNAKKLYEQIQSNQEQTQQLFRQALQDPHGAIQAICDFGNNIGLPVTPLDITTYLASIDDEATKQWVVKARGGL